METILTLNSEQRAKALKARKKLEAEGAAMKTVERGWKDETRLIEDAVSIQDIT